MLTSLLDYREWTRARIGLLTVLTVVLLRDHGRRSEKQIPGASINVNRFIVTVELILKKAVAITSDLSFNLGLVIAVSML